MNIYERYMGLHQRIESLSSTLEGHQKSSTFGAAEQKSVSETALKILDELLKVNEKNNKARSTIEDVKKDLQQRKWVEFTAGFQKITRYLNLLKSPDLLIEKEPKAKKADVFGKSSKDVQKVIATYLTYDERVKASRTSKSHYAIFSNITPLVALAEAKRIGLDVKNQEDCRKELVAFKRNIFAVKKLQFLIPVHDDFYKMLDPEGYANYDANRKEIVLYSTLMKKTVIPAECIEKWKGIKDPSLLYDRIWKDITKNREKITLKFLNSFLKEAVCITDVNARDTYSQFDSGDKWNRQQYDMRRDCDAMLHFGVMGNDLKKWQDLLYMLNGLQGVTYDSEGVIAQSSPIKRREPIGSCRYYEPDVNEEMTSYIYALDLFLSNSVIPPHAKVKALQRLLSALLKNGHRLPARQLIIRGILPSESDILEVFRLFLDAKLGTWQGLTLANDLMDNIIKTMPQKMQKDLLVLFKEHEDRIALRIIKEGLIVEKERACGRKFFSIKFIEHRYLQFMLIEFNHLRNHFEELEKSLGVRVVRPKSIVRSGILDRIFNVVEKEKKAWKTCFEIFLNGLADSAIDETVHIDNLRCVVKECLRSQLPHLQKAEIFQEVCSQEMRKLIFPIGDRRLIQKYLII